MKFVVIIPAYNEAKVIGGVIDDLKGEGFSKIIVVDDGSSDKTAFVAKKHGAVVKSHNYNRGVAGAFRTGVAEALKLEPDVIIQLDADGQHRPSDIRGLLKPIKRGKADLVIGSRYLHKDFNQPWVKRLGNSIFTRITSAICHQKFTDCQSGFRAFRAEVARRVDLISDFTYVQEFIIRAVKNDFRVKEVPIKCPARSHGKSKVVKNVFNYGLRAMANIFRIYRDYKPIKFFGVIGVFFILLSFILGFRYLYYFFFFGETGHYVSLMLMTMLFVSGVQTVLFGFMVDIKKK